MGEKLRINVPVHSVKTQCQMSEHVSNWVLCKIWDTQIKANSKNSTLIWGFIYASGVF